MLPFVGGSPPDRVLTLAVINPLAAYGARAADQLETSWAAARAGAAKSSIIPWMRQISGDVDTVVGAAPCARTEPCSSTPSYPLRTDGQIILRQDAASAKLKDGYWELNEVTETRPGDVPKILKSTQVRTNLKREFVQERLTKPEAIAFLDLPAKIAAARSFGVSTSELENAVPFASVAALPAGRHDIDCGTGFPQVLRFNQSSAMIFGGINVGLRALCRHGAGKGIRKQRCVVPPFVAAWIPVSWRWRSAPRFCFTRRMVSGGRQPRTREVCSGCRGSRPGRPVCACPPARPASARKTISTAGRCRKAPSCC